MTAPRRARFASTKELFTPDDGRRTDGRASVFGDLDKLPKAASKEAAGDLLAAGAVCDRYWIRVDVARHAFSDESLLELLAKDPEVKVRRAAARHPNARRMLATLARDEDRNVRYAVLRNADASDEAIDVLCRDSDPYISGEAKKIQSLRLSAASGHGDAADEWAAGGGLLDDLMAE